ncbi:UNVERIFIED_CONTAM: hypothetical protein GTU68_060562 [Idotea baltica]|nr:hypothetical protein [Idotea baltica]
MIQPKWKLDHTAHAVIDIDAAIKFYQEVAGLQLRSRETLEDQAVELAFLGSENAETSIELISPTNESSSVHTFLQKRSEGLHHICFAVDDIDFELTRLAAESIKLVDPIARRGAAGKKIAFLHPKSCLGVLIELCQGGHSD